MSPEACRILVDEVMPILSATIPRLRVVGCDDAQEVTADAVASAAQMLDSAERAGKPLIGKSVAYYAIQRAKTGRRSTSSGRTDVMASATTLDGRSSVMSLDESVSGEADGEQLTLGEMLTDHGDDPCMIAGRNLDWADYLGTESDINRNLVRETARGVGGTEMSLRCGVSPARVTQRKRGIGVSLRNYMGDTVLVDAQRKPMWEGSLRVARERTLRWNDIEKASGEVGVSVSAV